LIVLSAQSRSGKERLGRLTSHSLYLLFYTLPSFTRSTTTLTLTQRLPLPPIRSLTCGYDQPSSPDDVSRRSVALRASSLQGDLLSWRDNDQFSISRLHSSLTNYGSRSLFLKNEPQQLGPYCIDSCLIQFILRPHLWWSV
jgi:hypothetical protein